MNGCTWLHLENHLFEKKHLSSSKPSSSWLRNCDIKRIEPALQTSPENQQKKPSGRQLHSQIFKGNTCIITFFVVVFEVQAALDAAASSYRGPFRHANLCCWTPPDRVDGIGGIYGSASYPMNGRRNKCISLGLKHSTYRGYFTPIYKWFLGKNQRQRNMCCLISMGKNQRHLVQLL